MTAQHNPLRLNVGFVIHADIGFIREFDFNLPYLHLAPDLDLDDFSGQVRFSRTPQGLLAEAEFTGTTQTTCVRCLEEVQQILHTIFKELYAFDSRSETESGLRVPANGQIDMAPMVRDYLLLDMPINPLCKEDCRGLCPTCGKNRNRNPHTHVDDRIDPRLSALKDLLDDGN